MGHISESTTPSSAGLEPVVSQPGFDEMTDARDWLLRVATELDQVTVVPSPPPGDPWQVGM